MDEETLDKVVDRAYLIGKGFRERQGKFIGMSKDYVICYYPVANGMYAIHYVERIERHVFGDEE